ncbi:uncharacterized protein LOC111897530 isoform X2 [Lactuca sativa]|uniref:uncharacterized protein LOC111897530 isoform X2 n=1 Tax=Lactuca sativa TaxID=4236 RepID=UPI001C6925EC|nr:uncharacterized protein LOC111897530 isoform X2 [Lactuca sativa]
MVLLRIGTPHNYKLFTRIIILKIMLFPILERISVNQKYMLMHSKHGLVSDSRLNLITYLGYEISSCFLCYILWKSDDFSFLVASNILYKQKR